MILRSWISRAGLVAGAALAASLVLAGGWACTRKNDSAANAGAVSGTPVGQLRLTVENDPAQPKLGENSLVITVTDSTGRPVPGAAVIARVSMPAMGSMPRMESTARVQETSPGTYRARYGLDMLGEWDLELSIKPGSMPEHRANYRISTTLSGVRFQDGTPGTSTKSPETGAGEQGTVMLDLQRRQAIGLKTEPVGMRDMASEIRSAGRVTYAETGARDVVLKYSGYVRALRADYLGRPVKAGEEIFTVYSPELLAAQQEFLDAQRAESGGIAVENGLASAARRRLELMDFPNSSIERIVVSRRPLEEVSVTSPAGGVIAEKSVVKGSSFQAGQVLARIQSVSPVWILASVPQSDMSMVRVGSAAGISDPFHDGRVLQGRVSFISPALAGDSRAGQVRIEAPNADGSLRPGMFVNVRLSSSERGPRLAVPAAAVLFSGERRVVFVDLGSGRLAPRNVRLGARAADYYEVQSGLARGDLVVTSGNFLLASESNLKSATGTWEGGRP